MYAKLWWERKVEGGNGVKNTIAKKNTIKNPIQNKVNLKNFIPKKQSIIPNTTTKIHSQSLFY